MRSLAVLGVLDASENVGVETPVVFSHQWGESLGIAVLGAFNEVSFVKVGQSWAPFILAKEPY